MELRLWVPLIQVLVARNWKRARSRCSFTALIVAKGVAVSTPLRAGGSGGVMVVGVLCVGPCGRFEQGTNCAFPRPSRKPSSVLRRGRIATIEAAKPGSLVGTHLQEPI